MIIDIDMVFDKIKDIKAVDQFGYVDLASILRENVAPSVDADGNPLGYDGVQDPHMIVGKPDDVFASMRMRSAIESEVKAAKAAKSAAMQDKDS